MTPPLLDHAAATLLTAIPETALLVAVTAIALACLPALTAAVRSRVWTVVFLAAILLSFAAPAHNHAAGAPSGFHLGATWELALLSAWVILSAVRGLTLLRSAVHLHRVIRRATPLMLTAELTPILKLSSRSLASISVHLSRDVDAPSVAGFFHPRILLPSSLAADLTQADLRAILLHEMQHLRRRDHWTNLFQKCALVLLPLNPALFWVERRLCLERELACDDGVLQSTTATAYATSLTNLAERSLLRRGMLLALGAWQRQSELSRRVLRILAAPTRRSSRRSVCLAAATSITLVIGLTATLTRLPQLVSFSSPQPAPIATQAALPTLTSLPTGSVHLVRAVMPMPGSTVAPSLKPRVRRIVRKSAVRPPSASRMLVLTAWQPIEATPVLTLAVQDGFTPAPTFQTLRFTYAAVPVHNGWLFLQL